MYFGFRGKGLTVQDEGAQSLGLSAGVQAVGFSMALHEGFGASPNIKPMHRALYGVAMLDVYMVVPH